MSQTLDRNDHVPISQKGYQKAERRKCSDQYETQKTPASQIVDALGQRLVELLLRDVPSVERAVHQGNIHRVHLPDVISTDIDERAQVIKIIFCRRREYCNCR